MLFWDFLGRCDLRHLAMLREAEAEAAERVAVEQERGEKVLAEADAYIAALRRQRRAPDTADDKRSWLGDMIAMFEEKQSAAAAWLVRRLAGIREGVLALEADVVTALENHGEVEELYTVRWTARHPFDRTYSRERPDSFFLGPNPPRRRNRTAEARLAWDRQYDDESDDDRRTRLDALREERRREWAYELMRRESAAAEARRNREAEDSEFARWVARQQAIWTRANGKDWRLTVEEASDLSSRVKKMPRHVRPVAEPTVRRSAPVRPPAAATPTVDLDLAARRELERGTSSSSRSDIDEYHDWMEDVGLV
jgi:hypothetical protein